MYSYQLTIYKQKLRLAGKEYGYHDLSKLRNQFINNHFGLELVDFLAEWFDKKETITLSSSGSTGRPKTLIIHKQFMINSAIMTCRYLQLHHLNKALLCLPMSYIAGKMMVVRALVAGLDLYLSMPGGNPLLGPHPYYDFAAMVPMQVYNILQDSKSKQQITSIKHLLIGGAEIASHLLQMLKTFPNNIYATYGMAETVSHIALSHLNQQENTIWFQSLPGIDLSLSQQKTLIIHAPALSATTIHTRDLAELNDRGEFKIIGRLDNVINSGGIKIHIEEIEQQLQPYLLRNFAITYQQDTKFGQRIVLLCEQQHVDSAIFNLLPSYQRPKMIYSGHSIPMTSSNKIDRHAVRQIADYLLKQEK